jgi:hypothetical protein
MDTIQYVVLPLLVVFVIIAGLIILHLDQNKNAAAWIRKTAFRIRFVLKWLLYAGLSLDERGLSAEYVPYIVEFDVAIEPAAGRKNQDAIVSFAVHTVNCDSKTSGVRSKAANWGQFKTGQRKWLGTVRCCTRSLALKQA